MSENICHLLGRIIKEPVLKYTQSGGAMAIIILATDRKFISKTSKINSDFHRVIIWNRSAELAAQTLHKGNRIFVTGSIENSNYTDKNGNKQYGYVIRADRFGYIDRKAEADNESETSDTQGCSFENPEDKLPEKPEISPEQKLPSMEDGEIISF